MVEHRLQSAPPIPGSMIVLPEMFATGFSMNAALTTKDEPQKTLSHLSQWATKYQVYIMAGITVLAECGKGKNISITVDPTGEEICRYQKIQTITLAGETESHEQGNRVQHFQWQGFTVSPFICFDLRFPEWFRMASENGTNLFVVIASWPGVRIQHWITLLQARAIENQAYVVGVNRCGDDPNSHMPGRSMVVDPLGNVLVDAGEEEGIVQAKIDMETVMQVREKLPFLKDKRFRYSSS
jgi:predicted amidohydrolase